MVGLLQLAGPVVARGRQEQTLLRVILVKEPLRQERGVAVGWGRGGVIILEPSVHSTYEKSVQRDADSIKKCFIA